MPDKQPDKPQVPDNSASPLPNRCSWIKTTRWPKTSEQRTELIDGILRDTLASCPLADWTSDKGKKTAENFRENLNLMATPKLMFLRYMSDPESPPLTDAEMVEFAKKSRVSHDVNFDQWMHDGIFTFFYTWLRRGIMEVRGEVKAIENIYCAVAERGADGKPTLSPCQREMSLAWLNHTGWSKPASGPAVVVNMPQVAGAVGEDQRDKFDQLAKIAAENEEQAAIIEALMRGKAKKPSPLATVPSDEAALREVEKNG